MSKQIHINLDDAVYEALTEYTVEYNSTMQDSVSTAVMQLVNRQKNIYDHSAPFTFVDLFAGIGGMRLAFESVGGHCVYSNEWNKYSQQTMNHHASVLIQVAIQSCYSALKLGKHA